MLTAKIVYYSKLKLVRLIRVLFSNFVVDVINDNLTTK